MGDLLVKLYNLPDLRPAIKRAEDGGFRIKRPLAPERRLVLRWVEENFNERWAGEVEMAFSGHPISCFVALNADSQIVGFACFNATFQGFFGPTGVDESCRGHGIGTALLLRSLHAMQEEGFAYAIIGYSSADEYYGKTVGAIPVPDSSPGPYRDRIGPPKTGS